MSEIRSFRWSRRKAKVNEACSLRPPGETLGTKIGEITSGEIPRGEEVEIEGKIREVLPTVRLGQEMYERLIVEDDTGTVTVVVKVTTSTSSQAM